MTGALTPLLGDVVLAHHMIIAAIPFLVPTAVITTMVAVMAVRDRRRGDQDHEDQEDQEDQERARYGEQSSVPGGDQRPG